MKRALFSIALFASAVPFALVATSASARAQTIFVTTVADVVDILPPYQPASLPGPDGKVSFREAVLVANQTAGPQTIGFHIPLGSWGTGTVAPVLINASTSFVLTDDGTTVDGTTQTAFTGDTNPNGAEVFFHSTVTDPTLIVTGTIISNAGDCQFIGLGDTNGRNYAIDLGPTAHDNTVTACVIKAVFAAVRVQGHHNVIGSTTPGLGNRLSSLSDGLRIHGFAPSLAHDNVVIGNYLTGEFNGVQIVGNSANNRVGGFLPGEANLITDAGYTQEDGTPDGAMVRIETDSHDNQILGNLIGTNATGNGPGNTVGDVGVEIYGDTNEVRGNVIGGVTGLVGFLSVQAGVSLREGADGNRIVGNWIGVSRNGVPIGNHVGVRISAFDSSLPSPTNNRIGGLAPGDGNVIAFNEAGAVAVALDAVGNSINGNSMHDNHPTGAPGIDLGEDGPTPNDAGDLDLGPNLTMNYPLLASAVGGPQGTVVIGRLDAQAPATTFVELFSNPAPAPGEPVEAKTPIGIAFPRADGTFEVACAGNATGLAITAIATDASGNSSEISGSVVATPTRFTNLGFGLAGALGVPQLQGGGPLTPASKTAFLLSGAAHSAPAIFVIGTTAVFAPVLGGTLVPNPQYLAPAVTGINGAAVLSGFWPGAPSGSHLFVQAWVQDAGAPGGIAASNAIDGVAP